MPSPWSRASRRRTVVPSRAAGIPDGDAITGPSRGDIARGGPGSGCIREGAEARQLHGRSGCRTHIGGPGRDTLRGGPGRDIHEQ